MNIYVGNLSYETNEDDLRTAFEAFGQVSKVTIIKDRETGDPRGFGFVEMSANNEGEAAIDALNGKDLKGRPLKVSEARPREERSERRGGGGGGRSGGGRNRY